MHEIGLEYGGAFYREAYSYVGDANPVGAMPSLHMAASLAVALAVLRFNWRLSLALALYGIGMGASLVYLGEHYVADLVVGAGVALLVYAAVEAVSYAQGWRPARSVHLGDLREAWARGEARVLQLLFVSRLRLTARRRLH
jgi:membrane-associated phospholipid phosphatase